jgi:branched-chain amino acid transport system substrate-binding protein
MAEGTFDLAHHQGTMSGTVPAVGPVDVLQDGTTWYGKVPSVVSTSAKPWIKVDLTASLAKLSSLSPELFSQALAGDLPPVLEILEGVGREIHDKGSAKLRDVTTTHLQAIATLDRAQATAPTSDRAALAALASVLGAKTLPLDVWIDTAGRVRQLRYAVDNAKLNPPGTSLTGTTTSTIELYNFGSRFTPSLAPPIDQVIDINDLLSRGGMANTSNSANGPANTTGGPCPPGTSSSTTTSSSSSTITALSSTTTTTVPCPSSPGTGLATPKRPGQPVQPGGSSAIGPSGGGGPVPIGATGPPQAIVIGSVGNYSGLLGRAQLPMIQAVEDWVGYINSKGGLFGHPVRLIVEDDRGDSSQYVADLKDLVDNAHVVAFVENAAPATIASGDQYLRSVGVPVIGTACANAIDDTSPVIFPQCPTLADQYYGQVRDAVVYGGGANLAVLYCVEAPSCADGNATLVDKGQAQQAGATVKYDQQISLAQPDFTSECLNAKNSTAQLLAVLADPATVDRVARSCSNAGYHPSYLEGPGSVVYATKDETAIQRLLLAMPTFPFTGSATPAQAEFQQVMKASSDQTPGPGESFGWTAAEEFELAAIKAGQTAKLISPRTLIDALGTFSNETLGGLSVPLNFIGTHAAPASCWFPMQAQKGNWSILNSGQMLCR